MSPSGQFLAEAAWSRTATCMTLESPPSVDFMLWNNLESSTASLSNNFLTILTFGLYSVKVREEAGKRASVFFGDGRLMWGVGQV